jgi:dTDP-4-dehydrorhamnose reductase
MKLMVTGAGGMTGSELVQQAAQRGWNVVGFDHAALDITDPTAVNDVVSRTMPDVIINAAAYTAVDAAESDAERAMEVNGAAPGNLARAAQDAGAAIVHISTDYVFNGTSTVPYKPDDDVDPIGMYGQSKLAGEIEVKNACERRAIVRTSWVYSHTGKNFVRTMLGAANAGKNLRVVDDQHGSPTSAHDLAAALLKVADAFKQKRDVSGTYHFSNAGVTTWYGFAKAIFEIAGWNPQLSPCTTADYPTPAKRPQWSALDASTFQQTFGVTPRPWRDALAETISKIS